MRPSILALVLAGCAAQPVARRPVAGPTECERTADHLVGLMKRDVTGEVVDKITQVIIQTCSRDGWTAEARRCFLAARDLAATQGCAPLLTVEQRDAAGRAMDDALGAPPAQDPAPPPTPPTPPAPPATGE